MLFHDTHPQESLRRVYMNRLVCLSVRLCNRVRSRFFLWRNICSSYVTHRLLMTWGCVKILTQGHLSKFKVIVKKKCKMCVRSLSFLWRILTSHTDCLWSEGVSWFLPDFVQVQGHWKENMHIFCLLYTFLMKKHWKILLYIKSAYDLRICQEIDL